MSSFLRDAWYVAAWSTELADGPLARRICDDPILLLRRPNDKVVALLDRCPHRFAPLSQGSFTDDMVQCPYHGLGFSFDGQCIRSPFTDKIPPGLSVKTFPIVERDHVIWIWMGEKSLADETSIPALREFSGLTKDRMLTGYTLMNADFEYATDNLMDLTHLEFVHRGTFGGRDIFAGGKHSLRQDGETLHSNWWIPDVAAEAIAHTHGIYPPEMRIDHWLDMRWDAPAILQQQIGAAPVNAERQGGVVVDMLHLLTPETEDTSHYFWASTAPFPLDDPSVRETLHGLLVHAFDGEDKPLIEAAYRNRAHADFWDNKPAFLGIDAGGTKARRILEAKRKQLNA